jgi:hypothetical protein
MSEDTGKAIEKDIGAFEVFDERVKRLGLSDDTLTSL